MARGKYKFNTRNHWYMQEPEGTLEEKENSFKAMESCLYKLIDYGTKDEEVPQEVIDEERRLLSFCRLGPRSHYFTHNKRGKLTSADVLYMLTCNRSSEKLGEMFGVDGRKVRAIRNGEKDEWYWEYSFVRRIKSRLLSTMRSADGQNKNRVFYSLSKVHDVNKVEVLHYISSLRVAKNLRKDIINKKDYEKMIKDKTLDILYPITKLDIVV